MPARSFRIDERRIGEIVALAYDAALDAALWSDVVATLAREVNAERGVMALAPRPTESRRHAVDGPCERTGASQFGATGFGPHSTYFDRVVSLGQHAVHFPPGSVSSRDDLLDHARLNESDLQRSEFFDDWFQPDGRFRVLGCYLPLSELEFLALGFYRSEHGPAFGCEERCLLDLVMRHLVRSLQFGARLLRLEGERSAARAFLDELTVGVAFLDEVGHLLDANQPLLELAARQDGLQVGPDGLRASSASITAALRRLVRRAISPVEQAKGAVAIERPSGRRSLHALVTPLRTIAAEQAWRIPARAVVIVADPDLHPTSPPELLRAVFGLTDAEARIAIRLERGACVGSIAQELGIRMATVRNHLKQIFQKTGTHRQAELVSLLYSGPWRVHPRGEQPGRR